MRREAELSIKKIKVMRSKIAKRILDRTPDSTKNEVVEYADTIFNRLILHPTARTFSEKAKSFIQSAMFWIGRKKGMIHTRNIGFKDIRAVFFPINFYEKYRYLGSVPHNKSGDLFKALYPLVLAMDYEAKPKLCPRWFLRFLHLLGNDNSIVRVRNRTLHNLKNKLTKGIMFMDWKTKWTDYDLRISIYGPEHLQELASAIEDRFCHKGRQTELVEQIKAIDPEASIMWGSTSRLENQLEILKEMLNKK